MAKLSRARCITLWQAAGVLKDEAIKLANDLSIGALQPELQPHEDKPLILLIGEFGAGKSLIAERLFQKAIKQACEKADAPVPVYLKAQKVVGQLQQSVEAEISNLGESPSKGALVIIDGADETRSDLAFELLNEARVFVSAQLKNTVFITSRPIPTLIESEEAIRVAPLSNEEAYALVERFSGRQITPYLVWKWPQSVHDAIHRPLFAVLLGIYLRDQNMMAPESPGKLLSNLIDSSLRRARVSNLNIEQLLQRLATLSTDSTKGLVFKTEVALPSELQILLNTGLVVEDAETISFALPILTQWFAAQSLAAGIPEPNDLTSDPQRLERWRYPLAIFVGSFDHYRVSKLLAPLAEKHPAFAAQIVNEELARTGWNYTEPFSLPQSDECGRRIRTAMQAWVNGIEPLSQFIAPVREDGTLLPIGIDTDEFGLTTAWYHGSDNLPDVVKLPSFQFGASLDWSIHYGKPSGKSTWAWEWILRELVSSLSKLLQNRMLPVSDGSLLREAVWQTALKVTKRGTFHHSPIPLVEIAQSLPNLPLNIFHSRVNEQMRRHYLNQLKTEVNRLYAIGEVDLHPPWPEPDRDLRDGWIWEGYTQQQLLARAKAVYTGALEGYQQLVNRWFQKFAPRLKTAVMMPVRLVGVIPLLESGSPGGLSWYFEVRPRECSNVVDFNFAQQNTSVHDTRLLSVLDEQLHSLRPEATMWTHSTSMSWSSLDIFGSTPATDLAYSWLWNDLQRVAWVNGQLGNAPL